MKKIFAVLLVVAMLCTMSVSTFAAGIESSNITGDTSASLTVKYTQGTGKKDNYAATITWGSMEFTYTSAGQKWNTDKMIWEDNEGGTWSSSTITVKNKSSQSIDVIFGYTPEQDSKGVTGYSVATIEGVTMKNTFVTNSSNPKFTVEKATAGTNGANGTETVAEFPITPTGIYTGKNTEAVKVGTITITLS